MSQPDKFAILGMVDIIMSINFIFDLHTCILPRLSAFLTKPYLKSDFLLCCFDRYILIFSPISFHEGLRFGRSRHLV